MKLIAYIDGKVNHLATPKTTRDTWKGVRRALAQFLGDDADIDILETAKEGWTEAYYHFLLTEYVSRKSAWTRDEQHNDAERQAIRKRLALQRMGDLRWVMNSAIADGVMPDFDIFANIPECQRKRGVKHATTDFDLEIRTLINARTEETRLWADRYLICIYLAGLPMPLLNDTIATVDDTTRRIALPHLGIEMTISRPLREKIVNHRNATAMRRIGETTVQTPTSERTSDNHTHWLLRSMGANLYRGADTFADWLALIAQTIDSVDTAHGREGIDCAKLKEIVTHRYTIGSHPPHLGLSQTIEALACEIANTYVNVEETANNRYWFACKTHGRSGEDVMGTLLQLDAAEGMFQHQLKGNIYCPCRCNPRYTPAAKRRKSATTAKAAAKYDKSRTVMRNMLFVRTTDRAMQALSQTLPNTLWVFRHAGPSFEPFVHVPAEQLHQMQTILNYLSDYADVEISFNNNSATNKPANESLAETERVKILIPGFGQYEAYVDRKDNRKSTAGKTYYKIQFLAENNATVEMSIPRELLETVENEA